MTRGITALMACSALLLASGCGESSEPPKHPVRAAETGPGGNSGGEYIPGPTTPAQLPAGGASVTIRDIRFSPEDVTVKVGSAVVWLPLGVFGLTRAWQTISRRRFWIGVAAGAAVQLPLTWFAALFVAR